MDEAAKRRLVGAAVLVALAVIFVPMLVEEGDDDELGEPIVIPEAPEFPEERRAGAGREAAERELAERDWAGEQTNDALPEPQDMPLPLPTPKPPAPTSSDRASSDRPAQSVTRAAEPAADAERRSGEERHAADAGTESGRARPAPERRELAPAGPKSIPSGVRAWVVQVASLRAPEAARTLQNDLRAKGYPAFVEQANVNGQRYYRVRVGPEVERAQADRLADQLASDTGSQPLVQRYP
jgi:DedD protein